MNAATPPAAAPQPTVSQPIAPQPAPAPQQVAPPPQPQPAPQQPLPTTSTYPGVYVTQPQPGAPPPQPVGYAVPPAYPPQPVPGPYGGPPAYPQPQQPPPQQYIPQPQVQPQYAPPPPPAPQPQAAPPVPAQDAATLAAPPEVRALLRPGESMMHFTHLQIGRRFWRPAERPIGETVRVYIIGAEWYLDEGIKSHFFQCKPLFQFACSLDTGAATLVGPGEIVLVPVTAETGRLLKTLANANQYVADAMLRHKGKGMLDVWMLNSAVPRAVADQR